MQAIDKVKENFVKEMLSRGVREGNRGSFDYRKIVIEKGVIPHAEGSAQVDLGNTKVLVGIKIDVDEPMPDKPDEGNIVTSAELLPLASAEYDAGPPSPESIELARVVDRGIRAGGVFDTKKLFIEEGKVWSVFIDLYVLNYDGNLFDACSLAAMAALTDTRVPKYEDKVVIREGKLSKLEIENYVTSSTYAKIDNNLILDPNGNEEKAMSSRLTIATDGRFIRAMQKGAGGVLSETEIEMLIDTTFEKSKYLTGILNRGV